MSINTTLYGDTNMRLFEIADNYPDLKARLSQPGTVEIVNASYSSYGPSLGTLEDMGAGKISRTSPYKGKWFGFSYYTKFSDGTPILANIDLGHNHIMKPGDRFMDEV